MTSDDHNPNSHAGADPVAQLIRTAGRRELPPAAMYERTLDVATHAWQAKVRRRRARMLSIAAAAVIAAVLLSWQVLTPLEVPAEIAQLQNVLGPVSVRTEERDWVEAGDNTSALRPGTSIRTGFKGRAGLRIGARYSVKLAEQSEIQLLSDERIQLVSGKLYVATLDKQAPSIVVLTTAGNVTDLGTQFEVQHVDPRLRVRIRQGAIVVQRNSGDIPGKAGEELSLEADGSVRRIPFPADHADWAWADTLVSTLDMNGQPLTTLLSWVERETGQPVRFASSEVERRAAETLLHGSVKGLAPLDALAVMLSTTDLRHRVLSDGTILVEEK